jgi:hypothetical protein
MSFHESRNALHWQGGSDMKIEADIKTLQPATMECSAAAPHSKDETLRALSCRLPSSSSSSRTTHTPRPFCGAANESETLAP